LDVTCHGRRPISVTLIHQRDDELFQMLKLTLHIFLTVCGLLDAGTLFTKSSMDVCARARKISFHTIFTWQVSVTLESEKDG
jgi:hypothetical protein